MAKVVDFLIVGSGFGGSVSALRLAEKGYSVAVLERGKRFGPEGFPKSNWNLFKHLWAPRVRMFGILEITLFRDLLVLSGSGVGGGSLVYANTLLRPPAEFFESGDWAKLGDWESELAPHYETAERMLGVTTNPKLWPADEVIADIAKRAGREHAFSATEVGVFFGEPGLKVKDPYFGGEGPDRAGCIHCGGCMVGCRYLAKNSLDLNYLFLAERLGVEVVPETQAISIVRVADRADDARYVVNSRSSTSPLGGGSQGFRAKNVVVSAGVMGTVELLFRSKAAPGGLPELSSQLGKRVRSNGEALMGITARDKKIDYSKGVAITSSYWVDKNTSIEPVRYPAGSSLMRHLGVPLVSSKGGFARRLLNLLRGTLASPIDALMRRFGARWARRSTIVLVMQNVENRLHLRLRRTLLRPFSKGLSSRKDRLAPVPATIEAGAEVVKQFAEAVNGIAQSGIAETLLNTPSTAHILGGCAMGVDRKAGVINSRHEVFGYPGLYVVDGSASPGNLGVNPSLTITAMAERAISFVPRKGEESSG